MRKVSVKVNVAHVTVGATVLPFSATPYTMMVTDNQYAALQSMHTAGAIILATDIDPAHVAYNKDDVSVIVGEGTGFGGSPKTIILDTTAHTGAWNYMMVLEDASFTTFTSDITANAGASIITGAQMGTLTAGTTIPAQITAVTLSSGKVMLYN